MDEKIKDYFNRYPQSNEVYERGGVLFHTEGAAQSYGTGAVVKHTRDENAEAAPIEGELTYKELLARCKELGIETADNKKDTLMAALAEYELPKSE